MLTSEWPLRSRLKFILTEPRPRRSPWRSPLPICQDSARPRRGDLGRPVPPQPPLPSAADASAAEGPRDPRGYPGRSEGVVAPDVPRTANVQHGAEGRAVVPRATRSWCALLLVCAALCEGHRPWLRGPAGGVPGLDPLGARAAPLGRGENNSHPPVVPPGGSTVATLHTAPRFMKYDTLLEPGVLALSGV